MAYRTADHTRWQQLNFVTGIEIKLSNNHNCRGIAKGQFYDICDELAGVYPKDFKFVGWHPFCRCFAVPKLADMNEFLEYQDKFVAGEDVSNYKFSGEVTQMPKQFNEWVKANEKRIKSAKSLPYFIRDNYVGGDIKKGLKFEKKLQQARKEQKDTLAPYRADIEKARQLAIKWGLSIQLSMLDKYVAEKNISGVQSRIATIQQKTNEMIARDKSVRSLCTAWGLSTYILDEAMKNPNSQNILSAMSELENRCITAENDYKQYITDANSAISEAKANNIDATDVQNDVNVVSNDKREWNIGKTLIRERLRKLWDLIKDKSNTADNGLKDWVERTQKETIIKTKNDENIEKSLKISKGAKMTFDEANALRGNPKYQPQYIPDSNGKYILKSSGQRVSKNPKYKKAYTVNCQSCVVAYELRRRGFNLYAKGKTKGSTGDILSKHTELAWLDSSGKIPEPKVAKSLTYDLKEELSLFNDLTKDVGRYHIKWKWNNSNNGHIITCERFADDTLKIYDPQNGKIIVDFEDYALGFDRKQGIKILKVDDLDFNTLYSGALEGNKAIKRR